MDFQLAQINVAKMIGTSIDDPVMEEFKDNLDRINALAEQSEGFVWRLKDDSNNATSFNPFNDPKMLINLSVWEDVENLEKYTYQTLHTDFLKKRRNWFERPEKPHFTLWWVEKGKFPTLEEAMHRLDYFQKNGPTEKAFDFRRKFAKPI